MRRRAPVLAMGVALALAPAPGAGQSVDFRTEIGATLRGFPSTPLFADQGRARLSPSLLIKPRIEVRSDGGSWRMVADGFARLDANDDNRTHVDMRELGVRYLGARGSAFVGLGQTFWGVTEVRHLVDIVNQVDGVEDLDGEDRLGQPMVSVTVQGVWGALDLYWLPYFRERTFPAADARLRGPLPIGGESVYTAGHGPWHTDLAAHLLRTLGRLDLGLSAFRGTSREPRLSLVADANGRPTLRAEYDDIDQIGLDAQWTGAHTLLKLEAATRGGYGDRLYAVSGGVERTLYQVLGSNADLGLLAEVMYDSRGSDAPPTLFEHDLFVGGRWALNDVADTSVLGGPLIDMETAETLFFLESERRLGSAWRLALEARLFGHADAASPAYGVRRDGYVSLSVSRFF